MTAETVVVIDFETTGLNPEWGARATEVAAVRIVGDEITDSFQSLMDAGVSIPPDIEKLTGITNAMRRAAPVANEVIKQLFHFMGCAPLVAHNARFDEAFLKSEFAQAGICHAANFACTVKLARRVYPRAPNHKLQTLIDYADIPHEGQFHRALADATATANLWLQMRHDLCARYRLRETPSYEHLSRLSVISPSRIDGHIKSWQRA